MELSATMTMDTAKKLKEIMTADTIYVSVSSPVDDPCCVEVSADAALSFIDMIDYHFTIECLGGTPQDPQNSIVIIHRD